MVLKEFPSASEEPHKTNMTSSAKNTEDIYACGQSSFERGKEDNKKILYIMDFPVLRKCFSQKQV